MFRSARQGRQGRKTNHNQLTHQHVTDQNPPIKSNSKSAQNSDAKSSKKSHKLNKHQTDELENDQIYDYQANTHSKAANRLNANQIDDHRLTGSLKNEQEDETLDQSDRINDFLQSYQKEDGNGFGIVQSEDDESIDSDEAMGELDDDQLKSKKNLKVQTKTSSSKARVRFEDSNTSGVSEEGSEDEADFNQDQFVDASTMLDIGAESDHAFSDEGDEVENSDSCQSSSSNDSDEMNDIDLNEDDREDESKLDHIAKIVENLGQITTQKRKEAIQNDSVDQSADIQTKKRKLLPAQIESRNEGEILPTSGRVKLEDLLTNLSSAPGLSELKKSLKPLLVSNKTTGKGLLPAPLETRRQQQIERQIAYDLTKKEMAKWNETSNLARGLSGKSSDGKHRFVVAANNISSADKEPDATRWNMRFKPSNDLEAQVIGLLESSQLTSKKLIEEENDQLSSQGLGSQKIKEKMVEAKLARELMFRAERKAKRVAKIKSKTFRRIRKKEKQKKSISGGGEPDLEFMKELDGIDGGDRVQTSKEEMEIERARERISLKHSSQGKWAKKVAELKGLGSDRNAAIHERIRREELLKKKIEGHDSDEADEADSDFDSEASVDIDDIKAHALNQLAHIDSKASPGSTNNPPLKGLFAMKFMQNAMAAKERKAAEATEELRQQLLEENQDDPSDGGNADCGMKVQGNPGRMVFGPDEGRQVEQPSHADQTTSSKAPPQTTKTSGSHLRVMVLDNHSSTKDSTTPEGSKCQLISRDTSADAKQINPWLTLDSSSLGGGTVSRIKDLDPQCNKNFGSDTILAEKAKRKADKSKRKQSNEKRASAQDAKVEISPEVLLDDTTNGEEVAIKALNKMQDDDPEAYQEAIIRKGHTDNYGRTAFEQRELVKLAFADDQVVAQFHDEKLKQIQNDAPKDVDLTLPGWGDWVGKGGVKKSKSNKKLIKKTAGVEPSERKDSKLSNVIILESTSVKMNNAKKLSKYQLKDVPFPYVNKDQVEFGFNQPIGPEFNTRLNHRHLVRPDCLTKPGVFIHPVEKPV